MQTMPDWALLHHAYGTAEDVPGLLARAEHADETGPEWDAVWGRLCHQGTVYSASYVALPRLADMASRHEPAGYIASLQLAASILASTDGPLAPGIVRAQHADVVAQLRDIAERNLSRAVDDVEFLYGLEALMAFEDGGVWQRDLNHVADGEMPMECPTYHELLILDLDQDLGALASATDASVTATRVNPAQPPAGTVEDRLLHLSRLNQRTAVAARLPFLFGIGRCPHCATDFAVASALF